jgi:hypothetical protein
MAAIKKAPPKAIRKALEAIAAAGPDPDLVQREMNARRDFIKQGLRTASVQVDEVLIPSSDGEVAVQVLIDPADVDLEGLTLSALTVNGVKLTHPNLQLERAGKPSASREKVPATLRGRVAGRDRAALGSPTFALTATLSNNSELKGFKIL